MSTGEEEVTIPEGFGMKQLSDVSLTDEGKVRAVIATFDEVDNDGEVILSGSIEDVMKATGSAYNHDTVINSILGLGGADAPPVAKGQIRIEGSKAVAYLDYFMETQRGREAFLTVKAMGTEQPWSFAFRKEKVEKPTPEWAAKGAVRMLSRLGPLLDGTMEVSPVKLPGGKSTGTLSAKSAADPAPPPASDPPPATPSAKDVLLDLRIARVRKSIK